MEDTKGTPTKIRVQSVPSDYSDIHPKTYDPEFISQISNKMQVPDKIEAVDVNNVEFILRQRATEPRAYNMTVPDRIFIANDGSHVGARQELKHFDFEQFPQQTGSNYVGLITPPRTLTLEERFPLVEDKENHETGRAVQRPVPNGSSPTANCIDPDLLLHDVPTDLGLCSLLGVIGRTNNIDSDLPVHYVIANQDLCYLELDWTYNNIPYPEPYTPGISTSNTLLLNEEDETTQVRTQVAKLIRRVTVMEQENQKRSQREMVMYTVMFGYMLVKLFSYLFKSK